MFWNGDIRRYMGNSMLFIPLPCGQAHIPEYHKYHSDYQLSKHVSVELFIEHLDLHKKLRPMSLQKDQSIHDVLPIDPNRSCCGLTELQV